MRIGKNTPWLVKTSSGRILGPFFDKDLINRLRTREITLIDEVSRPCGRWIYIRDEPAFASIAEELRQKNLRMQGDDTTTRAEVTLTPTHTLSLTDPIDAQPDDRTEEISQVQVQYTEPIREVIDVQMRGLSDDTFVFEGDRTVHAHINTGWTKWLWVATALVLFSAVGFVVFRQFVAKPIQNKNLAQQGLVEAEEAFQTGDYERAHALYKRAYDAFPNDPKTYLPYSLLAVHLQNQTVLARRLLDNLLATQERDREKIQTAMALAYMADSQYAEAETRLQRALDVNQMFRPALINLGTIGLETQDYEKANNHLQLAIKDGSRDGIEFLYLTHALVALYEKEKDRSYLQQADRFLAQYLANRYDYAQEALVASIYIDYLLGKKNEIMPKIQRFLEIDPEQTDLHRHDPYIHRRFLSWNKLAQWCLKATENMDPLARLVAFEAMCLIKAGELRDANTKIDDAVQQAPRDAMVQAVYGYILSESNAEDRARTAFVRALDYDRGKTLQLPRLMMARACERNGEVECANIYWAELNSINSNSLPAIAGLAMDAHARNKDEDARRWIQKGLSLSANYRPLLVLQARK